MSKYYEVPLYWTNNQFHTANPNDLGEGWSSESDLIHEIASGGKATEISVNNLPAPINDRFGYRNLRVFRLGGVDNFAAIAER